MRKEQKKKRFLDQEYAMMRYKEGATDQEIAQEANVCRGTVSAFRKRNSLPPNRKKKEKQKPGRKLSPLSRDAAEARKHGMNYGEYMDKFYWPLVTGTRRK